jgi:hypothetical protein
MAMKISKRLAAITLAALAWFLFTYLLSTQCGFLVGRPANIPPLDLWTFQWASIVLIGNIVFVGLLQTIFYDLISYYLFKRGIEQRYDEVHIHTETGDKPIGRDAKFGCIYPIAIICLILGAWGWTGPAYCN